VNKHIAAPAALPTSYHGNIFNLSLEQCAFHKHSLTICAARLISCASFRITLESFEQEAAMTQQQFIEEIKRLSVTERIALLEAISRSLREDLATTDGDVATLTSEPPETNIQSETELRLAAVHRLRGIIKFDGDPLTDEELKDIYTDYVIEKYS